MDLHIHSTASDGTLTPAEIVAHACSLGLAAIAITDHDTVDGVHQILKNGSPQDIHFLSGVELSTAPPPEFPCQGSLHLLGYGFRYDDSDLAGQLHTLQDARRNRNPKIIAKLQALGIDITVEELEAPGAKRQTGRPHIAKLLVEKGVAASFDEAFDRFLGNGKPAYVDKYRVECHHAIRLIRQAGGIAVLAHPALIHPTRPWALEDLLSVLQTAGLQGLEVYYPEHSEAQTRHFLALARRHGMIATGGTDFHGAIKPGIEMGCADGTFMVPFNVYEALLRQL
ncbi:MAG: PHP domain-containing protein [Desulfobacteraceae bacterium]|nr:PHP domain-containing protein [Desulfobacteraceae bacterium]MBC2753136.1 PHP domain-containing protein [Desulfobacteraceae bacterium]